MKLLLILCLTFGLTNSFDLPDMDTIENGIAMLCGAITTRPEVSSRIIDRLETMINEHRQKIQQLFPRSLAYVMQQENKAKLRAGGALCKTFFAELKSPLMTDVQNNQTAFQFIQQMLSRRIGDIIDMIKQQIDYMALFL